MTSNSSASQPQKENYVVHRYLPTCFKGSPTTCDSTIGSPTTLDSAIGSPTTCDSAIGSLTTRDTSRVVLSRQWYEFTHGSSQIQIRMWLINHKISYLWLGTPPIYHILYSTYFWRLSGGLCCCVSFWFWWEIGSFFVVAGKFYYDKKNSSSRLSGGLCCCVSFWFWRLRTEKKF